MISAIAMCFKR